MPDDFPPRYYVLDPSKPGDPDYYFRLSDGGRYDRWDGSGRVHMTGPVRDYYSRAIEGGGAWEVDPSTIPGLVIEKGGG